MKYSRLLAGAACVFVCIVLGCPSSQVTPPPAPVLTGPTYDQLFSLTDGIQLQWQAIEGCTVYAVQVGADAEFASLVEDGETSQPSWTIPGDTLGAGTYWWRVRAQNGSGWGPYTEPSRFTIEQGAPLPPVLIAPEAGAFVLDKSPVFSWEASAGATEYVFEMVQGDDFEQKDAKYSGSTASTSVTVAEMPFDGLRRSWRVKACAPEEMCSEFSEARPFMRPSTPEGVPAPPQHLSPADGAIIHGGAVDLTWAVPGDADWFQSQIATDTLFSSVTDGEILLDTSEDISHQAWTGLPQTNAQYYWRVRAGSLMGWGMWSEPWSFTSAAPPGPDLVVEGITIIPTTPTDSEAITIRAMAGNAGAVPSPPCGWTMTLDGAFLGSGTVPAQGPGASTGPFEVTVGPLRSGSHAVEFVLDQSNAVDESDESNNHGGPVVFTVTPTPRPDLAAGAIIVEPSEPNELDVIVIHAGLTNQGTADAGSFIWQVLLDGSVAGEGTVEALAAGETVDDISVTLDSLAHGEHEVRFIVDASGTVAEGSELNNTSGPEVFTVMAVVPELTVLSPNGGERWRAGETVDLRWSLRSTANELMRISLLYGANTPSRVISQSTTSVPGENIFSWSIPENQSLRPDYYVSIECTTVDGLGDRSDGVFAIMDEAQELGQIESTLLPGDVSLETVWIPSGTYTMGVQGNDPSPWHWDMPAHYVTLTEGFWMGRFEVTKAQWKAVMGTEPWAGRGNVLDAPDSPAVFISWEDAQAFIAALSALTGDTWLLPTEAEWEYACRADTTTRFHWYYDWQYRDANAYAWYKGNCGDLDEPYAHVVGTRLPNPWGLFDMTGNAWEWCHDWFAECPSSAPAVDPLGPPYAHGHVFRGGSYANDASFLRSALHVGLGELTDPFFGPLIELPAEWAGSGFRVIKWTGAPLLSDLAAGPVTPPYGKTDGEDLSVQVEVRNPARAAAPVFHWECVVDRAVVASGHAGPIPASGVARITAEIGRRFCGMHEVYFVIDEAGLIPEINESNNTTDVASFYVQPDMRADLTAEYFGIYPNPPLDDDEVTFVADVENTGQSYAESFQWEVLVDGVVRDSGTIYYLHCWYDYQRISVQLGTLPLGPHVVELRLDTTDSVNESNEENNVVREELTVALPFVDLVAGPVGVSPTPCTILDRPLFCADIWNNGNADAGPFTVTIQIDDRVVRTNSGVSLYGYGCSTTLCMSVDPLPAGTHQVTFAVDTTNAVAESNEENNVYGPFPLIVQDVMPDLEIFSIQASQAPHMGADYAQLVFKVRNKGRIECPAFTWRTYVDGKERLNGSCPAIAAGGSVTITTDPIGELPIGVHQLACEVDPDNLIREANEENNRSTAVSFSVTDMGAPDMTFGYGQVGCAVLSHDDSFFVLGHDSGQITFWNTENGELLRGLGGHADAVTSVVLSGDDTLLGTSDDDGAVRIWDIESGAMRRIIKYSSNSYYVPTALAFSFDGTAIIAGGNDRRVQAWDIESGETIFSVADIGYAVEALVLSADGSEVITGDRRGYVKRWSAQNGTLIQTSPWLQFAVSCLAVAPDGQTIAIGDQEGFSKLWNTKLGDTVTTLGRQNDEVLSMDFTSDGTSLVAGSKDNTAVVWDTAAGAATCSITCGNAVVQTQYSQRNSAVFLASSDGEAGFWDSSTGENQARFSHAHYYATCAVASPDGRTLLTGGAAPRFWNMATGAPTTDLNGHSRAVVCVAFSPNGALAATAARDNITIIWDVATGLALHTLSGHTDHVFQVAFSPDSQILATGSWDRTVRLWNTETGALLHVLDGGVYGLTPRSQYALQSLAFSPDGKSIVIARSGMTIWAVDSGKLVRTLVTSSTPFNAVLWKTGQEILALTSSGLEVRNAAHGAVARTIGFAGTVPLWVDLSADGKRFLVGRSSGPALLCDFASGEFICRFGVTGSTSWRALFSPDGKSVITEGNDGVIRLWWME